MVPLVAYTDRFSAAPGEHIQVKVSSQLDRPYYADLVRIISADPNPEGPGMSMTSVECNFAGWHESQSQEIQLGSCGVISGKTLALGSEWTASVRVQPWLLTNPQTVLCFGAEPQVQVLVTRDGAQLCINGADGPACQVKAQMFERHWYELRVVASGERLQLMQLLITPGHTGGMGDPGMPAGNDHEFNTAEITLENAIAQLSDVVIAAARDAEAGRYINHFNGRIEHPCFFRVAHHEPTALDPSACQYPTLLAWWDLSLNIDSLEISDRGPYRWHGVMKNLPARGVRGSSWTGEAMCWKDAPDQYAAAHFHADDLYDCEWQTNFVFDVPVNLASGVYGIRLREKNVEDASNIRHKETDPVWSDPSQGAQDIIPVFITPGSVRDAAPVAVIMSTYTYQIYGNYDRHNYDDAFRARVKAWGAYPYHPAVNKQFGLACYDHHEDGSGVVFSSARRPILTMRPGALAYVDPRGSGIRHFSADMHLLAWLEAKSIPFDVLTDEELERDGVGALAPYKVVLTGSHPEYHTLGSLNAHRDYINGGGRLVYLGGNGFYWRIARSDKVPGVLEVRRAENGVRSWVAPPGEYYHALDGCYGGLWRNNGRAPQALVGIGFCAQGIFEGAHYRRLPASYDPKFAWIFNGTGDKEILGDFGYSGGGAAGFELDRAEPLLGTPPNAVVLCRSEGHSAQFGATLEELIAPPAYKQGERAAALVHADIVYFDNSQGGAVFSVGSITFCGSLPWNNFDNPVSTLLENVVGHFISTSRSTI